MEAFEQFVALALEQEDLVVSEAIKFPVQRRTRKTSHAEMQTHYYEVDLVGARRDKLVLASVKSFLGSRGVAADHVLGLHPDQKLKSRYALLNDPVIREGIVVGACQRFGYAVEQIELRLYVGRFAGSKSGLDEGRIRAWCSSTVVGGGPIAVVGLDEVATIVRRAASSSTYRDNAALMAVKVMDAAGLLRPEADTL